MVSLIQTELDLFEEYILETVFSSSENPQLNGVVNTFLSLRGINFKEVLNSYITTFEEFMKPLMTENGFVSGKKLTNLLGAVSPEMENVAIPDFRLIDVARRFEPILIKLGGYVR